MHVSPCCACIMKSHEQLGFLWSICRCMLVRYNIYRSVHASSSAISKYDLPPPERYREFFRIVQMDAIRPLSRHCSYFSGCIRDSLVETITSTLPQLLVKYRQMSSDTQISADTQSCSLQDSNSLCPKTNQWWSYISRYSFMSFQCRFGLFSLIVYWLFHLV